MNENVSMTNSSGKPMNPRDKIIDINEMASIAEALRRAGKTVVLCHGVFDLLHMGHVRHLEAARNEGSVLVVTVTGDDYVNKGPGRPIYSEVLRAEMLAALTYIDWVAINQSPTIETALRTICPDVYVKGSDYENSEEDVTGMIEHEREAIEEHGGKLIFTKDITFSSSTLINQYLNVYDPPLRDYLDEMRGNNALDQILALIEKVKNYRVLLVGETIIDEYQYISPLNKTPKDHIISSLFQDKEEFAGGVIAAANHVADFCAEVEVLSVLGAKDSAEDIIRQSIRPNVKLNLLNREGVDTIRKIRFIEHGHMRKFLEIYHMNDEPHGEQIESDINTYLEKRASEFDLVIVTDFGHGMIAPSNIESLIKYAPFLAVNVQSNSGNLGYNLVSKYPRADYICVDAPEARLATGSKHEDISVIAERILPDMINCSRFILTHGAYGCYTYSEGDRVNRIPAFTKSAIDTIGAGDAFLAVTSPLIASGGDINHVGFVGNAAGAMKVGIVGHRNSIEKVPLIKFITALLK